MRLLIGAVLGGFVAWAVAADHYGHILRGDLAGGIMCRVHGLSTIRSGPFGSSENICAHIAYTTPERDLWDATYQRLADAWSIPR